MSEPTPLNTAFALITVLTGLGNGYAALARACSKVPGERF